MHHSKTIFNSLLDIKKRQEYEMMQLSVVLVGIALLWYFLIPQLDPSIHRSRPDLVMTLEDFVGFQVYQRCGLVYPGDLMARRAALSLKVC
jgi:hypothetical protein